MPCVSADEITGGWFEVLEETYISPSGDNLVSFPGTETLVEIDIEPHRTLAKIDMLINYGAALPSSVSVRYNGNYTALTIVDLGNNLCRVYGNLPYAYYEDIFLKLVKSGTAATTYEFLSVKVSAVRVTDFQAQGKLYRSFSDSNPLTLPNNFSVASTGADTTYAYKLIPVRISDWRKYDSITLFGSITSMALNSFRASVGSKGLPYTITYMESIPTSYDGESWTDYRYNSHTETTYLPDSDPEIHDETSFEDGTGTASGGSYSTVSYGGAVLYTITIDLSGIDRTVTGDLECYFTCIADPGIGYAFNVQNCTGSVITADTSTVNWWTKFTSFMQNLFSPDTSDSDQFQGEAQEKADEMENANQVLDNVTKPSVDDIVTDFSDFASDDDFAVVGSSFGALVNDSLFTTILLMSLTVALLAYVLYGKR